MPWESSEVPDDQAQLMGCEDLLDMQMDESDKEVEANATEAEKKKEKLGLSEQEAIDVQHKALTKIVTHQIARFETGPKPIQVASDTSLICLTYMRPITQPRVVQSPTPA